MGAWLEQRTWRMVGGVSIVSAAGMAWYGSGHVTGDSSRVFFAAYWIVFLLLFLVAIYMVLLDLRYIRMQFMIEERDLYFKTLADETLRDAIREAQERGAGKGDGAP